MLFYDGNRLCSTLQNLNQDDFCLKLVATLLQIFHNRAASY